MDCAADEIDEKQSAKNVSMQESELQTAFFRVFVSIFKAYREFLIFPAGAGAAAAKDAAINDLCFDIAGFLKTHSSSSHLFLTSLMKTQAFQRFVEDRVYPAKDDSNVQFFDESIIAKV